MDIKSLSLVLLAVVIVIVGPFLTIWALNTLFPILSIPYTVDTWCASMLLWGFLRGGK